MLPTPGRSFLFPSVASTTKDIAVTSKSKQTFFFYLHRPTDDTARSATTTGTRHALPEIATRRTTHGRTHADAGEDGMRALMPEQRKGRSRLAAVRVGRSPAAASPSRRRRKSGSGSTAARPVPTPGPSRSRTRTRREGKRRALARSASEPLLWFGDARVHDVPPHGPGLGLGLDCPPSPPPPPLERPHTCFDVFAPDFGRSPSYASLTSPCPREVRYGPAPPAS
jgi:hypothetical protein